MSGKRCSLCKSADVTILTCPLNPNAKNPNPDGHPFANHKSNPSNVGPLSTTLENLPDVAMDNIFTFLDKKSLISLGQLSMPLQHATKHYVKRNSIVSGEKLVDGPIIEKLAMKGNEDALVYLLTSRSEHIEKIVRSGLFTYPIFRRCIPAFYPLNDDRLLLILKNLGYHEDPSIRKLAELIQIAQQNYFPSRAYRLDVPIYHPIYIQLNDIDSNQAKALQEYITASCRPINALLSIRQLLIIPYLLHMVISTINVPDDKITTYTRLCYHILLKFRLPYPTEFLLTPLGISRDEYDSTLASVLSITPPVVDIVPVDNVTVITVDNTVFIVTETTHNLEELEYLKSLNLHQLHFAHIGIRSSDDLDVLENRNAPYRHTLNTDVHLLLHLSIPRSWDHRKKNKIWWTNFLIGDEPYYYGR